LTRFDRVLCLQLWFEWRILKSIFAIFCFITSKKEESNQSKEKVASSLRQKCSQKMPVPELVRPIPWWWFFKDAHRSGRPSKIDDNEIKALMQANKHLMGACYRSKSVRWKCSWLFEISRLRKECLSIAWVERNLSDESHERLRSTHQTRRKRSVLEAYDHGRRKMDCLQQCQPKKKLE